MGVNSGSDCFYHVKIESLDALIASRHRAPDGKKPTVFLDANWLYHHYADNKRGPVVSIMFIAEAMALKGVNAVVCADGPTRHHSKKPLSNVPRR